MRMLRSPKSILRILYMALFNFVFLCTEYLFDGRMALVTDPAGVVNAQNLVLGASVIGFLLFARIDDAVAIGKEGLRKTVALAGWSCASAALLIMMGCTGYGVLLGAGMVCFAVFGVLGAAVCYELSVDDGRELLARKVGIAYALSVLIQFVTNNLVRNTIAQAAMIIAALALLAAGTIGKEPEPDTSGADSSGTPAVEPKNRRLAAFTLTVCIAFTTCIFSTLDNAVTLVHASGAFDIGQWPRMILALSGLAAGFLFDLGQRQYMSLFMYIITLLSTICVVVVQMGGPFLLGLLVFYISAGFFVVYFCTSFMDLSRFMARPKLWAGLGRAVNNLSAFGVSALSVRLLGAESGMAILVTAVVLFALINVSALLYLSLYKTPERRQPEQPLPPENIVPPEEPALPEKHASRQEAFFEAYRFTQREQEIFTALISSDENIQDIARKLAISRAALYRHISSMNEKTQTQNRIGLMQFYFDWSGER